MFRRIGLASLPLPDNVGKGNLLHGLPRAVEAPPSSHGRTLHLPTLAAPGRSRQRQLGHSARGRRYDSGSFIRAASAGRSLKHRLDFPMQRAGCDLAVGIGPPQLLLEGLASSWITSLFPRIVAPPPRPWCHWTLAARVSTYAPFTGMASASVPAIPGPIMPVPITAAVRNSGLDMDCLSYRGFFMPL